MGSPVPSGLVSHARRVCSLYKRALRNAQSWHSVFLHYREDALILRARFDENKNIRDLRLAKKLLNDGEDELWGCLHPQPMYFAESVGGCAHQRDIIPPDWVLDYWHQTEKDMYPKYFALREKRKKEYVEFYNKQYPNAQREFPEPDE